MLKQKKIREKGGQPPKDAFKPRSVVEKLAKQGLRLKRGLSSSWSLIDIRPHILNHGHDEIDIAYHRGLDLINLGTNRATCNCSESGFGLVILRIRTTDKKPDTALINSFKKSKGFKLNIELEKAVDPFYTILLDGVPAERMKEAMDAVDKAGKVLLEAKEMKQFRLPDTDMLAEQLKDVKIH